MKRPTLAGLVCIGLLIGLELSYRRFEVPPDVVVPSLAANQPLVFLLGSSRTRAGARPLVIEEELGLNGVPDAWVASVCHDAVTLVGLRHVWRERVAPLLVDSAGAVRGVVAIAVRLSALNDSHLESGELAWLPPDERLVSATHQASFAEHTSVAMHQRVHLFAGRRALLDAWQRHRRTRERQARLRDWTTEGAPNLRRVLDAEDFGQGERCPFGKRAAAPIFRSDRAFV